MNISPYNPHQPPEFSHIIRLSELGAAPLSGQLNADAAQRAALAKRFDLPKISRLQANYRLNLAGDQIRFSGKLSAALEQICVISADRLPVEIAEPFDIRFIARVTTLPEQEEIELAPEDCDVVEYENGEIDLGEAVAQTLFLLLDPYPRGPNADAIAREKGLLTEAQTGPFAALAELKKKLS